jgi:type II secretion system protein C
MLTVYPSETRKNRLSARPDNRIINVDLNKIFESGFFKVSSGSDDLKSGSAEPASQLADLKLLGTVTGPPGIARAMILKKGEKQAEIFKLWKEVYGYTLSGIDSSKVYLKKDKTSYTLDMYEKKNVTAGNITSPVNPIQTGNVKKTISRAEFQQKMLNNIDNAMQGVKAGPYRVNGQIEGFQLIRIRPYNVLYDYGLRSGDIIKRINGKKIDTTEKLYNMWQGFKNESKLTFDIERNGKIETLDVNITD